jgi:hypothetical protein
MNSFEEVDGEKKNGQAQKIDAKTAMRPSQIADLSLADTSFPWGARF